MKIITPCYPQANTTSKVSGLQLLAIKTELFRGLAITQSIVDAKGSVPIEHALDRLLSPFSFFDRYTHFIMVTASAESKVFSTHSRKPKTPFDLRVTAPSPACSIPPPSPALAQHFIPVPTLRRTHSPRSKKTSEYPSPAAATT
jgi:hypothetical protein